MGLLQEHFMNPLNLGKIKKTPYTAKNKSGFCGDTIETYLVIDDNKITDVKYQACGCWALIGSASVFSEYIKGKTIEEVLGLTDEDYLKMFGEIPDEKVSCVLVTKNGFTNAIKKDS